MKNEGIEAFKKEVYGSKITIERKINNDGTSIYKLFDENRKFTVIFFKLNLEFLIDIYIVQLNLQEIIYFI